MFSRSELQSTILLVGSISDKTFYPSPIVYPEKDLCWNWCAFMYLISRLSYYFVFETFLIAYIIDGKRLKAKVFIAHFNLFCLILYSLLRLKGFLVLLLIVNIMFCDHHSLDRNKCPMKINLINSAIYTRLWRLSALV